MWAQDMGTTRESSGKGQGNSSAPKRRHRNRYCIHWTKKHAAVAIDKGTKNKRTGRRKVGTPESQERSKEGLATLLQSSKETK